MPRSKKTLYNTVRTNLMENHPKILNILLILAFVSLTGMAAFLITDIVSFKSDASHKGPFSGLDLQIPQKITTTIKNWQTNGVRLIDQGKNAVLTKGPHNSTNVTTKISQGNKERVLHVTNSSIKEKSSLAAARLQNLRLSSVSSSKSSRNGTSTLPSQSSIAAITNGIESGSGSDTSTEGDQYSSSTDDSDYYTNATQSNNLSENSSQINQSQMDNNSSGSIIEIPPALGLGSNGNKNSSDIAYAKVNNSSFDNSSSTRTALEELQTDFGTSSSSNVDGNLIPDDNDSAESGAANLDFTESENAKSFSNLSNNSSSGLVSLVPPKENFTTPNSMDTNGNVEEDHNDSRESAALGLDPTTKAKSNPKIAENELPLSMSNQIDHFTPIVAMNNNSSSSSIKMPEILSNNTSDRSSESIESHSNSIDANSKIDTASNSSSQINEPKQIQINNRTKAIRSLPRKPAMPLAQKADQNAEKVQQNAETHSKNASVSGSSDESKQSQSNSGSRFKSLKIRTSSWTAKA
jgi:hypothetical protein